MYIFLLGVVGTLIAFSVVAPITYLANSYKIFSLSFSQYNISTLLEKGEVYLQPLPEDNQEDANNNSSQAELDQYDNQIDALNNGKNQTEIKPIEETNEDKYKDRKLMLDFSLIDILLFASVISATDAVAALTFIHEDTEPKLFAILFGEGVVNDAVCIVIYSIIRDFSMSGAPFTVGAIFGMGGTFLNLFICSFLLGLIIGSLGSLTLKHLKKYNLGRVAECSLIILFAYFSYIITEQLKLSPIIALLFNGIFNSHYSFYNLSFQAREESSVLSRVLSGLAEAFIFAYLGLTAIHYFMVAFSWSFMLFELVIVVFGRFCSVFIISFFMDLFKVRSFNLNFTEKGIMSCSGTIRGAIAFGLSISIQSNKQINRDILLSTTLSLVFISTVIFGALMPFVIKFFKSLQKTGDKTTEEIEMDALNEKEDVGFSYLHPNFDSNIHEEFSKETNVQILKKRLSYWIGTYWLEFDDCYIKPKLILNWPIVKQEHDEIAQVIQNTIKQYLNEKKNPVKALKEKSDESDKEHYEQQYEAEFIKLQDSVGKNEIIPRISRDEIMNKY